MPQQSPVPLDTNTSLFKPARAQSPSQIGCCAGTQSQTFQWLLYFRPDPKLLSAHIVAESSQMSQTQHRLSVQSSNGVTQTFTE